jgi:hypothetical protein
MGSFLYKFNSNKIAVLRDVTTCNFIFINAWDDSAASIVNVSSTLKMEVATSSEALIPRKPHGVVCQKTNFNTSIPRFMDVISSAKSDPKGNKPKSDIRGRASAIELTHLLG